MSVGIAEILLAKLTGQDIPRDEPRVRVRVLTTSDQLVIAGVRFAAPHDAKPVMVPGTKLVGFVAEAEVYESDVAVLERHVESHVTPEHIARVDGDLASDLAAWTEERTRGLEGKDLETATAQAERTFPGSWQGYFRKAFKRDPRPLLKVERVGSSGGTEKTKKAA